MTKIRVITKNPGMVNAPKVQEVEHSLDTLQALVTPEGSQRALIELVRVPELQKQGIDLFANEEGLFDRNCRPNIEGFPGQMLRGPVFFCSSKNGETVGLSDEQVAFVLNHLDCAVQSIF
jgi:hypothetical protein